MQVRTLVLSGRKAAWAAATAALVALAGCAMFRGNVKGNFQCSAPGGMCAPSSSIDDQALAQIEQNVLPAASDGNADTRRLQVRAGQLSQVPPGRGLKIVLPGHLDRYGRWREPQIVYADVSNAGGDELSWSVAPEARLSLSELASGAPSAADASALERQSLASGGSAYDDVIRRSYRQGRGANTSAALARTPQSPAMTTVVAVPALSGEAPTAATVTTGAQQTSAAAKAGQPATSPKVTAPGFPGAPQVER